MSEQVLLKSSECVEITGHEMEKENLIPFDILHTTHFLLLRTPQVGTDSTELSESNAIAAHRRSNLLSMRRHVMRIAYELERQLGKGRRGRLYIPEALLQIFRIDAQVTTQSLRVLIPLPRAMGKSFR